MENNNLKNAFEGGSQLPERLAEEKILKELQSDIQAEHDYERGYKAAMEGDISGYQMENNDNYYEGAKAFSVEGQEENFGRITNN